MTSEPARGSTPPEFEIVHDHLVQFGGAERVVALLSDALGGARVHTSVCEPALTHPCVSDLVVATSGVNKIPWVRRNHRWLFPAMTSIFRRIRPSAKTTVISTCGWAHLARPMGSTVVYWHGPPRWLYDQDRYLGGGFQNRIIRLVAPILRPIDRRAARRSKNHYANSTDIARRLHEIYDLDAGVIHPGNGFRGVASETPTVEPGYFLVVGRMMSYKNVDVAIQTMKHLPDRRMVIVGGGPMREQLESIAGPNVTFAGRVGDDELATLYAHCIGLVAVAYEDFGLTPVEAASFGRPTVALRQGGYLDTVIDNETGFFVDDLNPENIAGAMEKLELYHWDPAKIRNHASKFSAENFSTKIREAVRTAQN